MGSTTAVSTPQDQVDSLMRQIAEEANIELQQNLATNQVPDLSPPERVSVVGKEDGSLADRLLAAASNLVAPPSPDGLLYAMVDTSFITLSKRVDVRIIDRGLTKQIGISLLLIHDIAGGMVKNQKKKKGKMKTDGAKTHSTCTKNVSYEKGK